MKWRKAWLALLLAVSAFWTAGGANAAEKPIELYLNGQRVATDVAPYIAPGANVTMVPIRVVSERLGAQVDWQQQTKTATIAKAGKTIRMTAGSRQATVNGETVRLEASVQMRQSRVMVPIRFVSEQLGLTVSWNAARRAVSLTAADADVQPLRAAWISTVYNLDWPSAPSYGDAARQRREYADLLDRLQAIGLNAVIVQVRPAADALYPSQLVPWSRYLTGRQGDAPGYDPLAYMIEETHRRGMEFHAWFNPFRASVDANRDALAPGHVANVHPEWIVQSGNVLYLNPGVPQARQHIIDVVTEVVGRYDVDGVHLDDYFYPSGGNFADDEAFAAYNPAGLASKDDWRRRNIDAFIRDLGAAIRRIKPDVVYGVSPFGVWRNASDDPTGSATNAGVTAYDDMYADVRQWIRQEWIDYVMPQVYWSLSFPAARYDTLVEWWADEVRGTNVKLYIGHAVHKLGSKEAGWSSADQIVDQLKYNRRLPEVAGDAFFRAGVLLSDPLGVVEALSRYYKGGSGK